MRRRAALGLLPLLAGCYSIGFEPLEAVGPTLAVPIFRNETLRRNVELDLTRHVRREVLETTPLHLGHEGEEGVPVLRGTILSIRDGVLVTGDREEVLLSSVTVGASFGVYEDERLIVGEDTDGDGAPDQEVALTAFAEFDTTRGESRETATDEALRDLAEMIVFHLERRDDDRYEPNDTADAAWKLESGRQVALLQTNADWFKVSVPDRHTLRATIYFSRGDLKLRATDPTGTDLPEAQVRDAGRRVTYLPGERGGELLLVVEGDDSGAPYQLLVETLPDDLLEPNDTASEASPLQAGQTVHLLQRNDDLFRIDLPANQPLVATLEADAPEGKLELRAVDAEGGMLPGLPDQGTRKVTVPAAPTARRVFLRVSGDGRGRAYRLGVRLE